MVHLCIFVIQRNWWNGCVDGKPLRLFGAPPLQGGGVFLRTDKRWEAMHWTTLLRQIYNPAQLGADFRILGIRKSLPWQVLVHERMEDFFRIENSDTQLGLQILRDRRWVVGGNHSRE